MRLQWLQPSRACSEWHRWQRARQSRRSPAESDDGPAVTPDSSATTLRIATSGFVDSFNPFTSIYLTPTNIFRYMYESLVQYGAEDGSPTEGLAESWETSEEGTDLDVQAP